MKTLLKFLFRRKMLKKKQNHQKESRAVSDLVKQRYTYILTSLDQVYSNDFPHNCGVRSLKYFILQTMTRSEPADSYEAPRIHDGRNYSYFYNQQKFVIAERRWGLTPKGLDSRILLWYHKTYSHF